jgi:Mlc titration factor MtfA (ptsG expression regulator)
MNGPGTNVEDWKKPKTKFPKEMRRHLSEKVAYYNSLTEEEKREFEDRIHEFIINVRFTGINVEVDDIDRILVASSAVIPIFGFKAWRYPNIYEILLYPDRFNRKFETTGEGRNILGMVGTGFMDGKMALSKPALHHGFANETDKKNTAIHEFIHLIDKSDESIDGLPKVLLEKQYAIPWLDLIRQKITEINIDESDIRAYGGTSEIEFFAVAGEYFFEQPALMKRKHPVLYGMLEEAFDQNMSARNMKLKRVKIGRNDPCPCGSGTKFKKCCGAVHE